jgi:hypothetical protein|tara:strand:+ start:2156 stop:2347 length:192 start_codon:yes stop_codon:yes gene_type:complete
MEPILPVYIARKDVAMYFMGLSPKTLANENSKGLGPTPMKRGRLIFYRFDELKSLFVEERKES